jgi:two-component system chemotaxis response regulator CheB
MEMPKMRGTDFLRSVMVKYPATKSVVISAIPNNVFEALQAGAVDFISKPNTRPNFDNPAFLKETIAKIKIAYSSTAKSLSPTAPPTWQASRPTAAVPTTARQPITPPKPFLPSGKLLTVNPKSVVAIGASTGGTEAIVAVIKDLPENMPGIVIVQHMPPVFTKMYAERLDRTCKVAVREAQDGDRVEQGLALVAAGDKQMRLKSDAKGYYVQCGGTDKVSGHCPSVDVLFESVSMTAGSYAIGVILTGMGSDGAKGLLKMRSTGAHTIGQDQASCVVYGMPMVAYNIGGVKEQLPLNSIGDAVVRRLTVK